MISAMDCYGNPSSLHSLGVEAEKILSSSKRTILETLGVRCTTKLGERQLIFTGSGTEADNLALKGVANAKAFAPGKKIIVSDSEHPAILETAKVLESRGFRIVRIPTKNGVPDYAMIEKEADKDTILASFMMVNNETGAVYDLKKIAAAVKAANPGALVHTDCVQSYLKIPFSVKSLGVDLVTVSAHKINGPKGIGALYVSEAVLTAKKLVPIINGGGQENGMRSGTENLMEIAGFGAAAKVGFAKLAENYARENEIRSYLIGQLADERRFAGVKLNLPDGKTAPHIISITLPSIKSETMLHFLSSEGIFVSSGSACSSNTGHGSHVLRAFGLSDHDADCTIRVSLGEQNTLADADLFLSALEKGLATLVRI